MQGNTYKIKGFFIFVITLEKASDCQKPMQNAWEENMCMSQEAAHAINGRVTPTSETPTCHKEEILEEDDLQ